jgi:hypothetical protein
MRSRCCLCVCESVYPPIVARQRLGKNPHIVAKQRLGKNSPIVLGQWYSNWGTRKHLRGYVKLKKNIIS